MNKATVVNRKGGSVYVKKMTPEIRTQLEEKGITTGLDSQVMYIVVLSPSGRSSSVTIHDKDTSFDTAVERLPDDADKLIAIVKGNPDGFKFSCPKNSDESWGKCAFCVREQNAECAVCSQPICEHHVEWDESGQTYCREHGFLHGAWHQTIYMYKPSRHVLNVSDYDRKYGSLDRINLHVRATQPPTPTRLQDASLLNECVWLELVKTIGETGIYRREVYEKGVCYTLFGRYGNKGGYTVVGGEMDQYVSVEDAEANAPLHLDWAVNIALDDLTFQSFQS